MKAYGLSLGCAAGTRMGFYAKHVLPRFIDLSMRNKETARLRAEWVPLARGKVLEVGLGSGLNLPFYSSEVERVYGLDPSPELQRMARKRALNAPVEVDFLLQSAEVPAPLEDESLDTVVMTWTLCSIPNPATALRQIKRVLRPEGRLVFIEHGRSPDPAVAAWQERLTPFWKRIGGGCRLGLPINELVAAAGFHIREMRTCYLPGPRPMTYTYQGLADVAAVEKALRAG